MPAPASNSNQIGVFGVNKPQYGPNGFRVLNLPSLVSVADVDPVVTSDD
jgi:hypothetical protein